MADRELEFDLDKYKYEDKTDLSFDLESILTEINGESPQETYGLPTEPEAPTEASAESEIRQQTQTELERPTEIPAEPETPVEPTDEDRPILSQPVMDAGQEISHSGAVKISKDRAKRSAAQYDKETAPSEEKNEPSAFVDDYSSDAQRDQVFEEISSLAHKVRIKLGVMFVLFLAGTYLYAGHFNALSLSLPVIIRPRQDARAYLIAVLALTLLSVLINISPMIAGLSRIFKGQIRTDGTLLLFSASVIAFDIYSLLHIEWFEAISYNTLDFLLLLAFVLSLRRKWLLVRSLLSGFEIVSSEQPKSVLSKPTGVSASNDVMAEIGQGADVLYAAKAERISGYLQRGFSENDTSDGLDRLSFVLTCLLAVLCAALYFAGAADIGSTLLYLAAGFALISPCFAAMEYMAAVRKLGARLFENATVISGREGAKSFADAGILVLKESELLSCDDVRLHGMKLADHCDIKTTLTCLSALFAKIGGCLDGFFLKMFEREDEVELPPVSDVLYYERRGYTAKVAGQSVAVGSDRFMKRLKIKTPNVSVPETQSVIYFAMNGKLNAVFVVSYTLPIKSRKALELFDEKNIALALIGSNYQFDESFYTDGLALRHPENITILSYATAAQCRAHCATVPQTQAEVITFDGIKGLAYGLLGLEKTALNDIVHSVFRFASGIFALAVVGVIAVMRTEISPWLAIQVLLYQWIWSLPMAITARINPKK